MIRANILLDAGSGTYCCGGLDRNGNPPELGVPDDAAFVFGVDIVDFYISPDHYLSNSFYRKPNPGLFLKASKDYKFLLDKTLYIGDDKRDVQAAYNANTYIYYVGKDSLNILIEKNPLFWKESTIVYILNLNMFCHGLFIK